MEWKTIANGYQVSTTGEVKSLKYKTPRILKSQLGRDGYLRVDLTINGKAKHYPIHRLVAQAFLPNPGNKPEVNHRNGVKTDNRVENLEWVTHAENKRHAYDVGLQIAPQGETSCLAKLTNEQTAYIRDNPDNLTGRALAEMFGVDATTISRVQLGKTYKVANGFVRNSKHTHISNDVRDEVRRLYKRGARGYGCKALAKYFGVASTTIRRIIKGGD